MKFRPIPHRIICEAVIFLFPLLSEICAFSSAVYVKNSDLGNGSGLLFILATVKLASSLLEYKGFEEAYLLNALGAGSLFSRIGLLQLIQGVMLPGIIICLARFVLSYPIDFLFVSLLVWTGIITSSRQFLAYHWRAQLRARQRFTWTLLAEIAVAYVWLGLLAAAALASKTACGQSLAFLIAISWKAWVGVVLVLVLSFFRRASGHLTAGLSGTHWLASIGQAFTSQLSKEFFILVATVSLPAGFIARVVVTMYGIGISFPVSFFRIRVFEQYSTGLSDETRAFPPAYAALRKVSLMLAGCCLFLLPLSRYLQPLTKVEFPFTWAIIALSLTYPLASFDALAYFTLIKRGRRSLCSVAAATGGAFAIATGYLVARLIVDPRLLAFLFVAILGMSDFIVNRVSRILAYR